MALGILLECSIRPNRYLAEQHEHRCLGAADALALLQLVAGGNGIRVELCPQTQVQSGSQANFVFGDVLTEATTPASARTGARW